MRFSHKIPRLTLASANSFIVPRRLSGVTVSLSARMASSSVSSLLLARCPIRSNTQQFGLKESSLVLNQGLIGGKWVNAKSGATISVFSALVVSSFYWVLSTNCSSDPATGDEVGTVPEMGLEEVKEAIDAAGRAFTTWSRTTTKVTKLHS